MILTIFIHLASSNVLNRNDERSFVQWMRGTNNFYTGDEYFLRIGIFMTNARYVQQHNANPTQKFKLSLNKFSAMTPSEYSSLLGLKPKVIEMTETTKESVPLPKTDHLDWREKGVVNEVKDQGGCGSCWAFGSVQAMESASAIINGTLDRYSEQNLVDCCTMCSGCGGGLVDSAFYFIKYHQKGKVNFESEYPYTATEGTCEFDDHTQTGACSSYVTVRMWNEDDLAKKCEEYGPVGCGIDASHASFQLYSSGIYDEPECSYSKLNHAVGCVGFGVEGDTKYWIVRNSWGPGWGEAGYIRMIWLNNQCGIATIAYIPVP
ncbi:cysteine protease 8 [Tritrichomonas foetus]|uniref:Cysteine protease 8 n=1 Tax=Tritrichomonas foetus TaxID=1144522 RepID=A0A1J4K4T1_9EUKA|nr:cysteine protease 8 [Tritrichomonas foetus]|eukprot:OHT05864.1 cysteine protease 8 [Tritrichomonas foetus]